MMRDDLKELGLGLPGKLRNRPSIFCLRTLKLGLLGVHVAYRPNQDYVGTGRLIKIK